MDRRDFARSTLVGLAGLAAVPASLRGWNGVPGSGGPGAPTDLRVNSQRLLETFDTLSKFGATPEGGVHRISFSQADLDGREYVRELMESAGLRTSVDAAGNLIGRWEGREPDVPPLMTGSHTDSVPNGGRFDGNVGVVGALEAARTLHEAGHRTRHPLEVVVFSNEEQGKTGSRAMSGELDSYELDVTTAGGETIGEGLRILGGDPDRLGEVRREPGSVHAFLELHVEQGPILHREGIDIGVVEGIVGIRRWDVTVDGFANHAGTTPMDAREDSLLAAARLIAAVHRVAREVPGDHVATMGRIDAHPGAPNVIPGRTVASLEIRDLEMDRIEELFQRVVRESHGIAEGTGTSFDFDHFYVTHAAPTDPALADVVERAGRDLSFSTRALPSGAGHDAQSIAQFAPIGMIFVPSVDGISHSPKEFTRAEDMVNGADVLLQGLLAADELGLQ